jgi:hypothetical protein
MDRKTFDCRIVSRVVRYQRHPLVKGSSGDPAVGKADGMAVSQCLVSDFCPESAKHVIRMHDDELRAMPTHPFFSGVTPPVLHRPALQLGERHKRNRQDPAAKVLVEMSCSRISFDLERDDICINQNGGHHLPSRPSRRQFCNAARKSSRFSCSGQKSPASDSGSLTGVTPCSLASALRRGRRCFIRAVGRVRLPGFDLDFTAGRRDFRVVDRRLMACVDGNAFAVDGDLHSISYRHTPVCRTRITRRLRLDREAARSGRGVPVW